MSGPLCPLVASNIETGRPFLTATATTNSRPGNCPNGWFGPPTYTCTLSGSYTTNPSPYCSIANYGGFHVFEAGLQFETGLTPTLRTGSVYPPTERDCFILDGSLIATGYEIIAFPQNSEVFQCCRRTGYVQQGKCFYDTCEGNFEMGDRQISDIAKGYCFDQCYNIQSTAEPPMTVVPGDAQNEIEIVGREEILEILTSQTYFVITSPPRNGFMLEVSLEGQATFAACAILGSISSGRCLSGCTEDVGHDDFFAFQDATDGESCFTSCYYA